MVLFSSFTYGGIISFLPLYAEAKAIENVGVFFAAYAVSLGVSRPLSGFLADRYGRPSVILPGLVLMSAALCGLAWIATASQLAIVAVVLGTAFGASGPALTALTIDRVPASERGVAMGMFTGAFELGIASGSVVLGAVLSHAEFAVMWIVAAIAPVVGFSVFAVGWRRRRK